MKEVLYTIFKSRNYWKDYNSNYSFDQQPYLTNGANKLTLTGYFLDRLKDNLVFFMPDKLSKKTIKEDLEKFDDLCNEAKIIIIQPQVQVNSIANKYERVLYYNVAYKYKEKLRFIFDDPMDLYTVKKSMHLNKAFFNEFNIGRFHNDVDSLLKSTELAKYCFYESKKMLYAFYNHNENDYNECYGKECKNLDNIHTASTFLKLPFTPIPFEEKSNELKYACLTISRSMERNKKFIKKFGITNVERIGADDYKDLEVGSKSLSEYDILQEYNKLKFILSFPAVNPSLTWDRRRILFAMMVNSVLITDNDDAKYLGEPFILDKSIFTKNDNELINIAKTQKDYFFSHLKTKEEIDKSIDKFIN